MIILEKPFCKEKFIKIKTIEDIKNTKPNSTLIFDYCDSSIDVYNFCKTNDIPYGVNIKNVKELIFISNLNAKYAFADNIENAKIFQKIANEYLLDTKIILYINSFDEIEKIAPFGIDGVKLKENK